MKYERIAQTQTDFCAMKNYYTMKNKIFATLLIIILFFIKSTHVYAQCTNLVKGGGGSSEDGIPSVGVTVDGSGNIYFCGVFGDTAYFGSQMLTCDTSIREGFFLNKYDPQGNILWSESLGNVFVSINYRPITISGNSIYISCGASYFQQGTDTVSAWQVILWKLDMNGGQIWRKNFLSTGAFIYSWGIIPDGSGGIYLAGRFGSTFTIPPVTLVSTIGQKSWLAEIDGNGNYVWAKQAAETSTSLGNRIDDLVRLSNGNIAVCGQYKDSLQFDNNILTESLINPDGPAKYKPYVALFDAAGNNLWIRGFTTQGQIINTFFDCAYGLSVDQSDNIFFTGLLSDSTMIGGTLINADSGRIFYGKLSSNGNLQWVKTFGANNAQSWGTSIFADNQSLYLVGNFNGITQFGNSSDTAINTDVYVARADLNGNILFHLSAGADLYEASYSGYFIAPDNILIAGGFNSKALDFPFSGMLYNYNTNIFDSTDDAFFWKVCLDDLLDIPDGELKEERFSIYPNPTGNQLTVSSNEFAFDEIDILNYLGEKKLEVHPVYFRNSNSKSITMEVSELPQGVYFINVKAGSISQTKKLIIVR
jgi:hypothetical protein